jgi:hypothetical protein
MPGLELASVNGEMLPLRRAADGAPATLLTAKTDYRE